MLAQASRSDPARNEYLEQVKPYVDEGDGNAYFRRLMRADFLSTLDDHMRPWMLRPAYVKRYSWAVPNEKALRVIAKHGPIVEVGAGAGYWAYLLRARGVDVKAYDRLPPDGSQRNTYHAGHTAWTRIVEGGPEKVAKHPQRTLMLCWPPYATAMARRCLEAYRGDKVIYIGEWDGCTADEDFHTLLDTDFREIQKVRLPKWPGIRDFLTVWKRRKGVAYACATSQLQRLPSQGVRFLLPSLQAG